VLAKHQQTSGHDANGHTASISRVLTTSWLLFHIEATLDLRMSVMGHLGLLLDVQLRNSRRLGTTDAGLWMSFCLSMMEAKERFDEVVWHLVAILY
jgi:hypothetical protein